MGTSIYRWLVIYDDESYEFKEAHPEDILYDIIESGKEIISITRLGFVW